MNHPIVGQEITEEDEKILEYLKALDVTFTDDNGSFKIHLVSMCSLLTSCMIVTTCSLMCLTDGL